LSVTTVANFEPPEHLVVLQTQDWMLNHRVDTVLPGYLMLGARMPTKDLSLMRPEALAELGALLAATQKALN
jgi:diadenosine tetraphosphate (Ap4A) HIT family hydrolase